jgi:hypothetical protein
MRKLLFVLSIGLVGTVGCSRSSSEAEAKPGVQSEDVASLTVDEVDKGIADKSLQAADCNHPKLRQTKGVVPGAILISSPDSFAASELPADKGAKLVFYCADPG